MVLLKMTIILTAFILVLMGACLIEAVVRDRGYVKKLLLVMAGLYAVTGVVAFFLSLVGI